MKTQKQLKNDYWIQYYEQMIGSIQNSLEYLHGIKHKAIIELNKRRKQKMEQTKQTLSGEEYTANKVKKEILENSVKKEKTEEVN
jgi:hypothetical protein